ncbi:hypothetical protein [Sulfurimonas sp.]|uniref:hypothetical protein n=1 Tax=Sulfurimonas sp. TaxID=2022749 RepID=UPI00260FCC1D|nr:hypothetical protein [Sulfurimonas sp.]MCW8894844.1 hypothetical protein [Sulfurimonas sp.]
MQHNKVGEVKLFKQLGHFSLALILCISTLNAGSFEDFKRSQSESFTKFQDERDNTFNTYLQEQFKAYSAHSEMPLYEKPKPKNITPAMQKQTKPVGPKISIKIAEVIKPTPIDKPVEVKEAEQKKDINFDFYGSNIGFNIPHKIKQANFYPQNQKGISNFFSSAASSEYSYLIQDIKQVSKSMNLNDWGVYQLVLQISNKVYKNQDNSRLLSWFIFNKLGYAVKVGLVKKHVVLMHYSKKTIYSTPNYSFDDKKYYVIADYAKESTKRLFSYKQDYPGSTKPLDLSLKTLPLFASDIDRKTLKFTQFGNSYSIAYEYNKNLIEFMATYPQADYETFFNAPLDSMTYQSIASALKKEIDGKKASEAMNFVLSFVQKSFKYEVDNIQFGREKVMFAQETLYYDKSDCEDRAVLYAYLIKELFHVPVVGVKYKDHMATALYVPMEGDSVKKGRRKFVIADPTYMNASIGMSMSKYKAIKPESYIVVKSN